MGEPRVTLPGVDLMATGTWPLASGTTTFTTADLQHIIEAAQCPAVGDPVIKLGHSDPRFDGEPALGQVKNMQVSEDGTKLTGDLTGMPEWLGNVISASYPNRSVEGQAPYTCTMGHTHAFALTGLALLGVTKPGIGNLSSVDDVRQLLAASRRADMHALIQAAVQRGAISTARAAHWQQRANAGEDISIVGSFPGSPSQARENASHGGRIAAAVEDWYPNAGEPLSMQPDGDAALYAVNPLLTEMQLTKPGLVAAAMRDNPNPPRLFGSRDLPLFTASGLDPNVLSALPWPLRRPVAAVATLRNAYAMVQRYEGSPEMSRVDLAVRGENTPYVEAFSAWLAGPTGSGSGAAYVTPATPSSDPVATALNGELFGGRNDNGGK